MAYIKSAYFGDEKSSRNITDVLRDKIVGGKINVLADSSLLPMFEVGGSVKLTDNELKDINDKAIEMCSGNANDVDCIAARTQDLQRQKLEEKENESTSKSNVVKGRRLTVNVVDKDGKTRTLLVPDGQFFKLDGLRVDAAGNVVNLPKAESSWKFVVIWAGTVLYWLFQTFGTIGAYRTLNGYSLLSAMSFTYRESVINIPLLILMFILFTMPFGAIFGIGIMFFVPLIFGEPNLAQ
jgi:hypothetical protein